MHRSALSNVVSSRVHFLSTALLDRLERVIFAFFDSAIIANNRLQRLNEGSSPALIACMTLLFPLTDGLYTIKM